MEKYKNYYSTTSNLTQSNSFLEIPSKNCQSELNLNKILQIQKIISQENFFNNKQYYINHKLY